MNDATRVHIVMYLGVGGALLGLFIIFSFGISLMPLVFGIIVSTGSVLAMLIHPRVRHYNRATDEFDKSYRYIK